MPSCIYALVLVTILLLFVDAEIQYKHCLGTGDIGDLGQLGVYPNVCINNHVFVNETRPWSFWKSIVKSTNFSSCTFANTPNRDINFHGTTWKDVIFKDCIFGRNDSASSISFTHTSLTGVVFDGCLFHAETSILFENFAFENVKFRNCTFHSTMTASLGFIRGLTIDSSVFRAPPERTQRNEEGNLVFSQVTIENLAIQNSTSEAELRFQDATVSNLEIHNSELGSLACHEEIIYGRDATKKSEFSEMMISNVALSDGMYCDQTTFQGLHIEEVKVRNKLDLCKSEIDKIVVVNVASLSNETCSEFALCSAEVRGKYLLNVTTTKGTFQNSVFSEPMHVEGFSVLETHFDLTDTIFSQERINDECCTESCISRGCKCDVSLDPLFCPRGNSSVNVNVKGSCFPAGSTVSVVDNSGRVQKTSMQNLQHGHRVLHGSDTPPTAVYFFGHKTQKLALYKVFTTYITDPVLSRQTRILYISPGHLIPVVGRGVVPAREVRTGDALITEEGGEAVVAKVSHEVREGMYAPTTLSGQMSVDGIRVSCYTEILPAWFAHVALAPIRALYGVGGYGRILLSKLSILHETSPRWIMEGIASAKV